MQLPNILITNYCNQNCRFCFARQEMGESSISRHMSLVDYQKILNRLKKTKINTIKLLGGEPTLHPDIEHIIDLTLDTFFFIQVFTNGIFSDKLSTFMEQRFPRIRFTFNLMTPSFQSNQHIRRMIIKRIMDYTSRTEITLSLTIDPNSNIDLILKTVKPVLKHVNMYRIGLANPIAGKKNTYLFDQFPKIGDQLIELVSAIKSANKQAQFSFNCGFTRCMFTDTQYNYLLKNNMGIMEWGCFGKNSSMDIQTDLTAFHCFPLSSKNRLSIKKTALSKADLILQKKRSAFSIEYQMSACKKCPLYGHTLHTCPGPCIAYRINAENY